MATVAICVVLPDGALDRMYVSPKQTVSEVKERICARPAFNGCKACEGMKPHEFSVSTTGDERDALKIEFAGLATAHGAIRMALREGKEVELHVHPHDKKRLHLTYKGGQPPAQLPAESSAQIAAIHHRTPSMGTSQPAASKNPLEPVVTPSKSASSSGSASAASHTPKRETALLSDADACQRRQGRPRSVHVSAAPSVNRGTKPAGDAGLLQSPPHSYGGTRAASPALEQAPTPTLPPYFLCLAGRDGALFRFQCEGSATVDSIRAVAISQLHNALEALSHGAPLGIQEAGGAFKPLDVTDRSRLFRADPFIAAALQQNMIPTLCMGAVDSSGPQRHRKSSFAAPGGAAAGNSLAQSRSLGSTATTGTKQETERSSTSAADVTLIAGAPPPPQKSLHDLLANVDPAKVRNFFINSILSDSIGMRPSELRTFNRDDELSFVRDRFSPVVRSICAREEVELLYSKVTELPWPTYLSTSFLVTVHAPNCVKKSITMQVHESDGVEEFLAQACQSLQLSPSETMIKVTNFNEYLHEKMRLGMLEEVRSLLKKRKDVVFTVEPRAAVIARHGVIPEPADEYKVRMDGDLFESLLAPAPPDPDSNVRKLEDLAYNFQVKILKTENVLLHFPEYSNLSFNVANDVSFQVGVQLFHGNQAITSPVCTKPQRTCQFKEWVGSSQVTIKQLPRATKACITVTARHMKDCIPIGWAALQLFDHQGRVRAGPFKLPLWPKATANPVGSPLLNLTDKNPMCLNIELPRFVDTPVLHMGLRHLLLVSPGAFAAIADPSVLNLLNPRLRQLVHAHPLYSLTYEERSLLWENRVKLRPIPEALPKVLLSADWTNTTCAAEAISLMVAWSPPQPEQALQLLDSRFAMPEVREYAVRRLQYMPDIVLEEYLLQLVQALKYEPYHDSALLRFLLQRSLQNRRRIGHSLYWHLKSELMVDTIGERYGLMLQLYLEGCGAHVSDLVNGQELVDQLARVAALIKAKKKNKTSTLRHELAGLNFSENVALPVSSRMSVSGLVPSQCRYMDSFTRPLWVEFVTSDPKGSTLPMIFKAGDDLRADILTLQMFRIMDRLWQAAGLDLRLSIYGCTSTGQDMGFIEVVAESTTAAAIQKRAAKIAGPFMKTPLANWLKEQNPEPDRYEQARSNFIHSCAGYCVATYILGIGDRHNDNILITKAGNLFHIDFAHFLGNVQMWQGIKRERAPFVLTPEFVYVMGKEEGEHFQLFVHLCCTAYNVLRRHAHLFISLFAMMLSTGIPELNCADDIEYLCQAFALGKSDEEAAELFKGLIQESLKTMATQVNFFIHNMAHLQT